MADKKYIIADFIDKEIPPEVLEQLKIVGRVKRFIKPTTTSAVSTSEDSEYPKTGDLSSQRDIEDEIDNLIDDVKDFEDLVKQVEDLLDEHLKDMSIPAANDLIADAIKTLGGKDNKITKEIFDNANTIMEFVPLATTGIDPVLAALVGNGNLDGPYIKCSNITPDIGNLVNLKDSTLVDVETSLIDQSQNQEEQHNKKLKDMIKEFFLKLFWQNLWAKFIVRTTIINPTRQIVANPFDSFVCFFKRSPSFRKKSKEWLKNNGPMNKLLTKIERILICSVPKKCNVPENCRPNLKDFDCSQEGETCPDIQNQTFSDRSNMKESNLGDMETISDETLDDSCINSNELSGGVKTEAPEMFGYSPDCIEAAKIIINAVEVDAYKPS